MSIYINKESHKTYNQNLLSLAHIKEAFHLSDKILFATSCRLLDPYNSSTEESRKRLLSQYPIIERGNQKLVLIGSFMDIGYKSTNKKEILLESLLQHKSKPLEAHLDINNQESIVNLDLSPYAQSTSETQMNGFMPVIVEGEISPDFNDAFVEKKKTIDMEMPTMHLLKAELEVSGQKNHLISNGHIVLCPTVLCESARKANFATHEEINTFLQNQLDIINVELELALKRKLKEERGVTSVLRTYEHMINEYIESKKQ